MVVQATLRRALGVAARPGGHVHGEHQRIGGWQAADEQVAQPLGVNPAVGQRGIQAAPAAPVGRFQAQLRQGHDRPRGAQQGIGQVDQRVRAVGAAGVQPGAEGLQARQRR
jgi:hypothetical protein